MSCGQYETFVISNIFCTLYLLWESIIISDHQCTTYFEYMKLVKFQRARAAFYMHPKMFGYQSFEFGRVQPWGTSTRSLATSCKCRLSIHTIECRSILNVLCWMNFLIFYLAFSSDESTAGENSLTGSQESVFPDIDRGLNWCAIYWNWDILDPWSNPDPSWTFCCLLCWFQKRVACHRIVFIMQN